MASNAFRAIGNAMTGAATTAIGPLHHGSNWCDIAKIVLVAAAPAAADNSDHRGVVRALTAFGQVFFTEGYVRLTQGYERMR